MTQFRPMLPSCGAASIAVKTSLKNPYNYAGTSPSLWLSLSVAIPFELELSFFFFFGWEYMYHYVTVRLVSLWWLSLFVLNLSLSDSSLPNWGLRPVPLRLTVYPKHVHAATAFPNSSLYCSRQPHSQRKCLHLSCNGLRVPFPLIRISSYNECVVKSQSNLLKSGHENRTKF